MESALFRDIAFVLAAALVGGITSVIFRLPLLTGYIIAGVVFAGLARILQAGSEVLSLAQLGVVLLLFTLGIEFSFARLNRVFQVAVFGGIIQILGTLLLGLLILPGFGVSGQAALVLAFSFSLSSTAVVVKLLQEKGEQDSLPGEILVGWLLVQDLAVIPAVVLLPVIAGRAVDGFWLVPMALIKAILLVTGAVLAGRIMVPRFMNLIVRIRSREFFLLSVVTFVFAVAAMSSLFGLSPALGAFLAGLIISETSQNHAVFAEVRPLREIFMILFFVTLGALIHPSFLLSSWQMILVLTVFFLITKFIISFVITLAFGFHAKTSFWVAVGLSNIGEFSFLVTALGQTEGILTGQEVSLAVSVTLLTLLVTPVIFALRTVIWQRAQFIFTLPLIAKLSGIDHRLSLSLGQDLKNHVILCGFGRVGRWLGRACQLANIPFAVIEYNWELVKELKKMGVLVIYGDPSDREVLEASQVNKAAVLVIAIPSDEHTQELIIIHAKDLNPRLEIISRVHQDVEKERLESLGVKNIIQPEFEASLSMIHRILQKFGLNKEEVATKIKTIKREHTKNFKF